MYDRIVAIRDDLSNGNVKAAILKTEEVLRFQIEEDVSGRMRNAKMKMEKGNTDGAQTMVERVMNLLQRNLLEINRAMLIPISLAEVSARLLYIQEDLAAYKIHDALDKLVALREYDIPFKIRRNADESIEKLKEYDDAEAEEIVMSMIVELQKEIQEVEDEKGKEEGAGYHTKRLQK